MGSEEKSKNTAKGNKRKRVSTENHEIRKRPAHKFETDECTIYVGSKSNIKGLLSKCEKLIKNDKNEIKICCVGKAVSKGILLALQVCEDHIGFQREVTTSTIELVDNLVPTSDDADYEILKRNNSALQIRLFRPITL